MRHLRCEIMRVRICWYVSHGFLYTRMHAWFSEHSTTYLRKHHPRLSSGCVWSTGKIQTSAELGSSDGSPDNRIEGILRFHDHVCPCEILLKLRVFVEHAACDATAPRSGCHTFLCDWQCLLKLYSQMFLLAYHLMAYTKTLSEYLEKCKTTSRHYLSCNPNPNVRRILTSNPNRNLNHKQPDP